jgi:chromosome partitioning protein
MIISVFQFKGGTGKTTCTANLAAAFANKGKTVLMIDADPQAHLSSYFKAERNPNINDLLFSEQKYTPKVIRDKIDIIPSSLEVADLDLRLSQEIGRESKLAEGLENITKEYDFTIIDSSPYIGIMTINTLVAADYVLIPVQPEYFSATGLAQMINIIEKVKKLNKKLKILGALISRFDQRTNLHKAVLDDIKKNFPHKVFDTAIRENIVLAEAPAHAKTIFEYAPTSNGAEDYKNLADEIIKIITKTRQS